MGGLSGQAAIAGIGATEFVAMGLLPNIAGSLGVSEPTAKRDWAFARAWLFRRIRDGFNPSGPNPDPAPPAPTPAGG